MRVPNSLKLMRRATASVCVSALAGCAIVPKDGPAATSILSEAAVSTVNAPETRLDYALVALTPSVLGVANRLTAASDASFSSFVDRKAAAQARIAVGDVLSLTVFEASTGGLFLPQDAGSRNGNFVQIPNEQVDASGSIAVPYAGSLNVVGRTPQDVGREVARRLAKRAIEPQVVVTVAERHGNDVSVLGDVNLPTRFSMDPGGINVLGAVARAGGPHDQPYETTVTVQRGRAIEKALLSRLVKDPAQNVQLQAGDVVYLARDPKIFLALGATPSPGSVGGINNRRFTFDNDSVSLAEAIAKAGGLDDNRADARTVFLYRIQSRRALEAQGVDTRAFVGDLIPTIYRTDFSHADGFFLASKFQIRNGDVIFVSNSAEADANKFLSLIRGVTSPASDAALAVR